VNPSFLWNMKLRVSDSMMNSVSKRPMILTNIFSTSNHETVIPMEHNIEGIKQYVSSDSTMSINTFCAFVLNMPTTWYEYVQLGSANKRCTASYPFFLSPFLAHLKAYSCCRTHRRVFVAVPTYVTRRPSSLIPIIT